MLSFMSCWNIVTVICSYCYMEYCYCLFHDCIHVEVLEIFVGVVLKQTYITIIKLVNSLEKVDELGVVPDNNSQTV